MTWLRDQICGATPHSEGAELDALWDRWPAAISAAEEGDDAAAEEVEEILAEVHRIEIEITGDVQTWLFLHEEAHRRLHEVRP